MKTYSVLLTDKRKITVRAASYKLEEEGERVNQYVFHDEQGNPLTDVPVRGGYVYVFYDDHGNPLTDLLVRAGYVVDIIAGE